MIVLVLLAVPIADGVARAQSAGSGHGRAHPLILTNPPVDLSLPAEASDFMQALSSDLNAVYDQYRSLKKDIQNDYNVQFSMEVSAFGQWGTPSGGLGVAELVYAPTLTWTPFTNTSVGSGAFNFAFQGNQFWTHANTSSQQSSMGLITPPNDWGVNNYQYAQITYTHTFPGNWLAVSVGQYSFGEYDSNQYAGDAQTNFINYALAQNGTQAYANAGVGSYVQITLNPQLQIAGGLQSATDITGGAPTISGFHDGQIAYFMNAQWTPTFMAGGTYSLLYYSQPAVPLQPSASQGVSFSAVQNLSAKYGLFLRVNNASGNAIAIETSVAFGGIMNNPFNRNRLDQAGIGIVWDKTNKAAIEGPSRSSEWIAELYYSYTVFKALQVTPDIQLYLNPALAPNTSVAAVFSLRTTYKF
jgi:Carbohydrate-selective porin, OprB family